MKTHAVWSFYSGIKGLDILGRLYAFLAMENFVICVCFSARQVHLTISTYREFERNASWIIFLRNKTVIQPIYWYN